MAGRSRAVPIAIGGVALATGYYFYTAGGDPKVAKKEAERRYRPEINLHGLTVLKDDATTLSNRLKGNDYSAKEAQKQGEEWAQKAGSKIDATVGLCKFKE